MKQQQYYSNGKLLITAEYLVLNGAKAFALPTKFGQYLTIKPTQTQDIHWVSYDHDNTVWFDEIIKFDQIVTNNQTKTASKIKNTLIQILHQGYLLNPKYITQHNGYIVTTQLTFPKLWGLGTSSTLINNIAQWLSINPYDLLQTTFGGSGYDIACAQHNKPITYQLVDGKPKINEVVFKPQFANNLYFVYLNKKQNSKQAIAAYNKSNTINTLEIETINTLGKQIQTAKTINTFATAVQKHEQIIAKILNKQTVQESLFSNFTGVIKSLGAWGGDFILVIANQNPEQYFAQQGYQTVIKYHDIIL